MQEGVEIAGRYRLEELHGRGPMSEVWRAHDEILDRTVALKILGPAADLERFRREARAAASLGHENIMRVYDYGEDPAGPYMALEWLPGGTLEDRLADGSLPPAETVPIARGIAAGLAHMHARGFVHRDLKPANVLFDEEGRPTLADFGLARSASPAGALTEAGTVLGTAAYISPEQAAGEPATPASDIYSFGIVLFRMLTGALPFVASDALTLLDLHRTEPAPPLEALNPDAPPELAALADAALQKDPAARPPDGAAALAALGVAPADAPFLVGATDETVVAPAAVSPKPRQVLSLAVGLFLLAGLGALLAWGVSRPASTPKAGITSGGAAGAHTTKRSSTPGTGSTTAPTPTSGTSTRAATRPTRPATTRRQRTTTAQTTTGRTTRTQPVTTAPTTTQPTTTAPTTTQPTTTTTTTTPTTTTPTTTG